MHYMLHNYHNKDKYSFFSIISSHRGWAFKFTFSYFPFISIIYALKCATCAYKSISNSHASIVSQNNDITVYLYTRVTKGVKKGFEWEQLISVASCISTVYNVLITWRSRYFKLIILNCWHHWNQFRLFCNVTSNSKSVSFAKKRKSEC